MKIQGFSFSAVAAGVRYKDRLDVAMIHSETPCVTAGVFTTSMVKAAPVVLDMERLQHLGQAQTILANSGCANACTGEEGMEAAKTTGRLAAERLGIDEGLVLLSSTGVIGEALNVEAFEKNMDELVGGLSPTKFDDVARAIMTTDTVPKTAERTLILDGKQVSLIGVAKGSGMIMPNMATMLAYICTDVVIDFAPLQEALRFANSRTFNRITVDGDTSTNDMVLIMANGCAGNTPVMTLDNPAGAAFVEALEDILKDLSLQVVRDGEGASKMITVRVESAGSEIEAEVLARTVANSALVKTAFFGEDANWGRILAALGRAGVLFDPNMVDIFFNDVQLARNGRAVGGQSEAGAAEVLKEKEILLTINMKRGVDFAEIYTCDFSLDYVKINADYRS
ncbi:bifunctional glutamate N-acetyltransferase/amino-acid acetyltransferase ArgJ [Desulforhopalus vacuolatus]|uniref:bifunctional glutamate N-acetyltransferase/amino-acid acetyltransferase ArgJ n=1 Tax=Desulforhopalus vacuolatus TaxID=40414 RepID=UPI0019648171|nr:bifunctional glutamate N-acetyltransferase/amino-acid acetyltransferase ArgJ [Desulforhopalus vacuolatus]MBM9519894.1 bifunctional glutamate N-acetyltransferase/amino-acid acetyltransferase ArgJ [Desulforhopalus vacuolatus]